MIKIVKYSLILVLLLYGRDAMASWDFLFLNNSYRQNIKAEAYVVSEEQTIDLLKDSVIKTDSLKTYHQLFDMTNRRETAYLFIRLKNVGDKGAWGKLRCKDKVGYLNHEVIIPFMTAQMQGWNNYIISLNGSSWGIYDSVPEITVEWDKVYTK